MVYIERVDEPDSLRDSDPGPLRFRGTHSHEFWSADRECGDTEDAPEAEEAAESTINETVEEITIFTSVPRYNLTAKARNEGGAED